MDSFSLSLVREKIVFSDASDATGTLAQKIPNTVKSNRILIKLKNGGGTDKIVIRAQNMHSTLRLAARVLLHACRNRFSLKEFEWVYQWDSILSDYERKYNPDIWAAVYVNGRSVFKTMTSPFVDIVEQCALLTSDNYDATMEITETALKKVGQEIRIQHSSNVAAVITDSGGTTRCGIMQRSEGQNTTFNFTAAGGDDYPRIIHAMHTVADFLEAINLRFLANVLHRKVKKGEVHRISKEADQAFDAVARVTRLGEMVAEFERIYKVNYRPERPKVFSLMKI